jgi:hypothetical protein
MRLCYPDLPELPLARPMWVATPSTVGTPVRRSSCSAVVQADWHDAEPLMHLFRSCLTIPSRRHRTPLSRRPLTGFTTCERWFRPLP